VRRFLEEAQKEQEDIPPQRATLESKKAGLQFCVWTLDGTMLDMKKSFEDEE
jgi:hypothetical protein